MQQLLSLVLVLLPSTTTPAAPSHLPLQLKDCLVPFQYDTANNHGSWSCALWLNDAIQLQHAHDKDTGGIQRAVKTVCQQVGLSKNHCSVLTRQTVKAAGEEFAWRDKPSVQSVEDIATKEEALALLANWLGWGKVAWFFGDSHLRKLVDTMLRLLGIDTLDRHGIGHQLDCLVGSGPGAGPRTNALDINSNSKEAEEECWCPSMFRITKKDGKVRKMGWHDAALPREDSMTLVFRYFVVRSSSMSPSDTGSYDRACVFHEGATNIAKRIKTWREDRAGTVLVDPDAIVFNAGNWESNEIWNAALFGQDVKQRAAALRTAYRRRRSGGTKRKVVFMGPPYYDDAITELCPGHKRGLKTSLKVQQLTRAAMDALLEHGAGENDNAVECLDVSQVTQKGASHQMKFWHRLKWCGGTYEMCANHQTPSMYKLMWKMLANLTHTGKHTGRGTTRKLPVPVLDL